MTAHPDGTPHGITNRVGTMLLSLRLTLCMATAALVTGCASTLTGYQSETEHTCPNAGGKGLPCTPVSDVFKRAMAGQLPGQLADGLPSPGAVPGGVASYGAAGTSAMQKYGSTLKSFAEVLEPFKDELPLLASVAQTAAPAALSAVKKNLQPQCFVNGGASILVDLINDYLSDVLDSITSNVWLSEYQESCDDYGCDKYFEKLIELLEACKT